MPAVEEAAIDNDEQSFLYGGQCREYLIIPPSIVRAWRTIAIRPWPWRLWRALRWWVAVVTLRALMQSAICSNEDDNLEELLRSILGLRWTIALRRPVVGRWWSSIARLGRRGRAVSSAMMLLRTPTALARVSHSWKARREASK